jgi:Bacterial extracellular solute-binding proteins, family 3.
MKMIKKCLVSLSFIAAVLAVVVVGTASAEKLRVGMECTYAPFNFKNANGELMGYDVDVAKGVAGLIGARYGICLPEMGMA